MNLRAPWLHSTFPSLLCLSLAACGGGSGVALRFSANDNTATAQAQAVQAGATASSDIASPTFRSSDGVLFTLTEARIFLRDIRLDLPQGTKCSDVSGLISGATCKASESKSGDDGSGTVVVSGPLTVDLLSGVTTPDLSGLRLPAGTYKRIDFRLEEARSGEVPADSALLGYSLQVKARFEQDSSPATLDLKLKFSEDARFESSTGVQVGADEALLALLAPQTWLAGLPVSQCLRKGDLQMSGSVLTIDDRAKGDCGDAEKRVRDNIKNSGRLHKASTDT